MQCFLKDADRKQDQDHRLRNRVAEIRDLAYDAEDAIDAFILKAAHQGGFHGVIKRFTSIFTKPFHLHRFGGEVKAIRIKLEDISKSLPAYEISGEGGGSRSVSMTQQLRLRRTYSYVEEEDVVSLENMTRDVLAKLMTEEEDRSRVVVSIVDPRNSPIRLPLLTDDESWKLFKWKAFFENTRESDARSREFERFGREMVKKCEGLPLTIIALRGLLATKRSRAQWEMVQRNIHAHLNKVQQQDEDWEISKKELIGLWIAEGFIPSSLEIGGTSMEDVAEEFFQELINRCLVQVGRTDYPGTGVKTCRIHEISRELCMKKAREENFLEIIQPPLLEYTVDYVDYLDVTLTASMLRRVAIHPNKRSIGKLKNLHTLQVQSYGVMKIPFVLDSLGIADLSELEELEIEEGAMPCLRSSSLSETSCFSMFPERLKYLTALQEMKLKWMKMSLVERIQAVEEREGDDYYKVRHIPSIQIFDTQED
ncbi:hypothetical protein PTKIN_Ptkin14bG0132200 [Pterospermum kingtungense]